MVVALKEVSIHGDFRTTVEYLIKLLETQAFEENSITTGWLDMLIPDENLTAEKPDKMLAVICDAVAKAYTELILRPWKPSQNINVSWKKVKFLAKIYYVLFLPLILYMKEFDISLLLPGQLHIPLHFI